MKSKVIKGGILAGVFSVMSLCSALAQDYSNKYGIVAKEKFDCVATNNDYKHSQFTFNTCDKGSMAVNMSTRSVLVNENYKQQVAPIEVLMELPFEGESKVPENVAKEVYYKDQASM